MDLKNEIFKLLKADVWKGWYYFLFSFWVFSIWIILIAIIPILATLNKYYPIPETTLNFVIYGLNLISNLVVAFTIYLAIAEIIEVCLWLDERRMKKENQESKP